MTESYVLSLFVYPHFLCSTCVASWLFVPWKRCGRGVMSRSYFTSCPSQNTAFRQTRTRKKGPDNLANTFSDALAILIFFLNFFRRWQIPLAVTSSTWQDKLTWQVELSPCPLAPLQSTRQVITCQVVWSSQLEQSSYQYKCRTLAKPIWGDIFESSVGLGISRTSADSQ